MYAAIGQGYPENCWMTWLLLVIFNDRMWMNRSKRKHIVGSMAAGGAVDMGADEARWRSVYLPLGLRGSG